MLYVAITLVSALYFLHMVQFKKKEILRQFNILFVGCIFALVARGTGEAAASFYILPFTAGGFIYIATVSVIPGTLKIPTNSVCQK